MLYVNLNRVFFGWTSEDEWLSDPDILSRYRLGSALAWPDVLKRRRVVILAEAGSGKTEELKEQARLAKTEANFAVYATVQDVARKGLAASLSRDDEEAFSKWRASDNPGWFFLDSIDEAKLDHIRLESALAEIARAISGAEGRAHIVMSGRHTDWEFRRDLSRLEEALPLPQVMPELPTPTPEQLLINAVHNEKAEVPEKVEVEKPLIIVMASIRAVRAAIRLTQPVPCTHWSASAPLWCLVGERC